MQIHECREDLLQSIVCEDGWKIAEVGVFLGDFSAFLLSLAPAELHLIDPFEGSLCSGDRDGNQIRVCEGDAAWTYVRGRFEDDPGVYVHRTASPAGVLQFYYGYFDLIYIDGEHTYEAVKKDLRAALSRVKKDGWICGHDYGVNPAKCTYEYTFGVKRAVDEFCETNGLTVSHVANDGYQSYAIRVPL